MICPLCKKPIEKPEYYMGVAVCDKCFDAGIQEKMKQLVLKIGDKGLTRILKEQWEETKNA